MSDIVEWLRAEAELVALDRLSEAADVIEALREQVDALRLVATSHEPEALRLQAEIERQRTALEEIEHTTRHEIRRWDIANEIARRALEPKP